MFVLLIVYGLPVPSCFPIIIYSICVLFVLSCVSNSYVVAFTFMSMHSYN